MINSLITSRKNVLPPLFPRALFSCRWRCWSFYTVTRSRLLPLGSETSSIQHSVNETVERFMPGLRLWVRMCDATAQSQICCLQHGETGVKCVKYIFVWSCPTWPSRRGMHISIDWPRLKSCQAVCDECTRGAICSGQSRDAGCFDMWDWPESCVTKIWGLSHDHGFVLFLFATMGFHIARSGIFWTPTSVL